LILTTAAPICREPDSASFFFKKYTAYPQFEMRSATPGQRIVFLRRKSRATQFGL
jgi:hypothetical protein